MKNVPRLMFSHSGVFFKETLGISSMPENYGQKGSSWPKFTV